MANVFISYKHDAPPDVRLANFIFASLTQAGHSAFIDHEIPVGREWPRIIEEQLTAADYVIVFLSASSAASEMIIEEIAIAKRVRQEHGRPSILPVRIAYEDPLPYDLGAWLNRLQYAMWRKEADDADLLGKLLAAIASGQLPAPPTTPAAAQTLSADGNAGPGLTVPLAAFDPTSLDKLDSPGGAVRLNSPFYVVRELDQRAKQVVTGEGVTLLIKGSRQTGKTSALARINQNWLR